MKTIVACLMLCAISTASAVEIIKPRTAPNPQIDYAKFVELAKKVKNYREKRRVTEARFLKLAAQKGTIILDTRSKWAYDEVHIKGAVHLNFSDITKGSLEKVLGKDKNRKVLIYCNNNFRTKERALTAKKVSSALNIPTFVTLYDYGYKNLYELGPVVDSGNSMIKLVRKPVQRQTVSTEQRRQ